MGGVKGFMDCEGLRFGGHFTPTLALPLEGEGILRGGPLMGEGILRTAPSREGIQGSPP